jgi:cullin-4
MGKRLFRKYVFSESKLKPSILRAICDLFDAHRNGQHDTEPALLKECIKMLHDLTVYTSDFEPAYLRSSAHYFYRWADEQSATQDLAGYIEQCGKLMQGEIERCKIFGLEYSTDRELAVMLDDILVRGKIDLLANEREVWRIFDDHSLGVLKLFYSLLHRIELLSKLERPWESYIKAAGASVINDEKREGEMVVRLLVLKAKVDSIWKSAFGKNQALGDIIRESFSFFINQRPAGSAAGDISNAKPAEMIAKHIDRLLRDGLRAITAVLGSVGETGDASAPGDVDAQLDRELDRVLELFRFIEGKAVFEAFYKKDLARRLLLGRSASADAEQNMLTRLKNGMPVFVASLW